MPAAATDGNATRTIALAALAVALIGAATILGALYFEYVEGLRPCPLCLEQRIAYYMSIPLAVLVAVAAGVGAPRAALWAGLGVIALAMLVNAGLGVYHSGIEWGWWVGPQDCSGPVDGFGPASNLITRLESINVVRCDEAPWRFLGLSLAGYNALISFALALIALWGILAGRRHGFRARGGAAVYGSSSVSQ
jgi:disulfide bond formation protein DsbB